MGEFLTHVAIGWTCVWVLGVVIWFGSYAAEGLLRWRRVMFYSFTWPYWAMRRVANGGKAWWGEIHRDDY